MRNYAHMFANLIRAEAGTMAICNKGAVWIKAVPDGWVRYEDEFSVGADEYRSDRQMADMMDPGVSRPVSYGPVLWALY